MSVLSLLFYIYLLIIPLAILGFGLWLLRYLTRMDYAPEKRILFTVIVIACLTFIAFSLGLKLNNARSDTDTNTPPQAPQQPPREQPARETTVPQQPDLATAVDYPTADENQPLLPAEMSEEDKLRLFETEHFPGLYEQRMALGQEIKNTDIFFQRIYAMSKQTPKQYNLLRDVSQIRKNGYDKLKQRNVSVSQYLREFWVHYSTGDSHDAIKKFTPVAVQLEKKIKVTRGQLLDNERQEAKLISSHMIKAGTSLKNNAIPRNQRIVSYTKQNRQLITDWLREKGSFDTLDTLSNLVEQRKIINARIQKLQSFKQNYRDLDRSLSRTLGLWEKAKESNYYAEYRLLYAAELRYVVEKLSLAGRSADQRLDKDLQTYTNAVAQHADVALDRAEQAYKPESIR